MIVKQDKKREKLHEREKNLNTLEDMSVIGALFILLLALIFLIDVARYQWVLMMILALGILLNLNLTICGFLRRKWFFWIGSLLVALGLLGALVYLLLMG